MTVEMVVAPIQIEPSDDPFRYGWRIVKRELDNGDEIEEQIPLTYEDVLHPEEEDFHVHTIRHERWRDYLTSAARRLLHHVPNVLVLSDQRISWDMEGLRPHGPDVAIVFGASVAARGNGDLATFDVRREGVRPQLIFEITSPETRSQDLHTKVDHYELAGVDWYIIIDAGTRRNKFHADLIAYRLTPDGYIELRADDGGRIAVDLLSGGIGLVGEHLYLYDAAGEPVKDVIELDAALTAATARAEQEAARAEQEATARANAERRVHELEARLAALGGD